MKAVQTSRGARLMHAGHVVSEVLSSPGPTHSVFDVLAAAAFVVNPHRLAILGFAGGGLLAPLCAMGFWAPVEAVDLSEEGLGIYTRYVRPWAMPVAFHHADAAAWLAAQRTRFDAVIEDLSVQTPGDVSKPELSFTTLPPLMARKLTARGVAIFNALPVGGRSVVARMAAPYAQTRLVSIDGYYNQVVMAGEQLAPARELGQQLRAVLELIGSRLATCLEVRGLRA